LIHIKDSPPNLGPRTSTRRESQVTTGSLLDQERNKQWLILAERRGQQSDLQTG